MRTTVYLLGTISGLMILATCWFVPLVKIIILSNTAILWALSMAFKKALSKSTEQSDFVEDILLKMIFPLSARENLKLNWLHPVKVNVPSVIFNLMPELGNYNLNLPVKESKP